MSNDDEVQQAVLAELRWERSVIAAHIGVGADAGIVTLSGHVGTFPEKHAAEAATRRVKGVKAIVETIEVRLAPETDRTDEEIAAAALGRLAWNVSVLHGAIKFVVENGWVTLSGQVDRRYQKDAAEQVVSQLDGVTGVSNQVSIKPKMSDSDASADIMRAQRRSWFFDTGDIAVFADDGFIRLTGRVGSADDREQAGDIAWGFPETTFVENNIEVT